MRRRVAIEAVATGYWYRFVGLDGKVIGIDRFGVSAPPKDAFNDLSPTVKHIIAAVKALF